MTDTTKTNPFVTNDAPADADTTGAAGVSGRGHIPSSRAEARGRVVVEDAPAAVTEPDWAASPSSRAADAAGRAVPTRPANRGLRRRLRMRREDSSAEQDRQSRLSRKKARQKAAQDAKTAAVTGDDGPAGDADKEPDTAKETGWEGLDLYQPQGPSRRPKRSVARRGGYFPTAPGAPSTTRQAQILNPAILAAPTGAEGIAVGRDKLTNSMVVHDPFTAYRQKIITSPGVIVLGIIGSGKSSLVKTAYVLRPLTFRKRRCVVVDRKDQEGEGEYALLTRQYRGGPFKMLIGQPGIGTTLNPLDDQILQVIGVHRQRQLLRSMAERSNDGTLLDTWQNKALRVAHQMVLRDFEGPSVRQATLSDLVPLLGQIDDDLALGMSKKAKERLHQAGLGVRFLLEETIEDSLDGLFNGETSKHVNLDSKLTTFDISQLPEDGPAAGMVMAVAQAWTLGRIRHDRGWGTNFVVEEGWDMVSGPIGRAMKTNQLLARGLGLSMVVAMHHIRQVAKDSDARELLQEPQTIHLYRQEREEDVAACIENFGLDPASADALRTQDAGHHLLKIGSRPEIPVQHIRSAWEASLTNTDNAMHMGNNTAA